jgi:hypothetical protein
VVGVSDDPGAHFFRVVSAIDGDTLFNGRADRFQWSVASIGDSTLVGEVRGLTRRGADGSVVGSDDREVVYRDMARLEEDIVVAVGYGFFPNDTEAGVLHLLGEDGAMSWSRTYASWSGTSSKLTAVAAGPSSRIVACGVSAQGILLPPRGIVEGAFCLGTRLPDDL